ncbi:hypothetical protein FIV42_17060 [Persicimonas caeni]|uniref:Transposase IS200-like domain-containing protein n=1 Tax=Persicimonas caeni TaxID=2292766 RepID=A0A4Y6PVP9_PERCE|nr:transposase [Persicimonas caeni]QDG52388.1 hypothetical protein FIV42_17060 [Persicimonas caeni]QED33610.1 hypothetical protein FRD00_17055 [Persicimonas caeni]
MQSYWELYVHLVWGTKGRSHILRGDGEVAIHRAIRDTAKENGMVPICVNSAWNHTHSLFGWNLESCVQDVVDAFKQRSLEAWEEVRAKNDSMPTLEWQAGFSAFTISRGQIERTKQYIAHQKDHHRNGNTWSHFEKWCTLESESGSESESEEDECESSPSQP